MKTTKTNLGFGGSGKEGDDDPNKDRWTWNYKSSHANDEKPSVIEIKYQQLIESNKNVRKQTGEVSSDLADLYSKIGINLRRLNLLSTQNRENKERLNIIEKTVEDNTNNLNALNINMDKKIQEMSIQMAAELDRNQKIQQELYQEYLSQTNKSIEQQNDSINQQISQYRQDILANNENVINNSSNRINEIAENATTSILNNITNFILTFGGLFDTRIVGYLGVSILAGGAIMLMIRSRSSSGPTIIIQTPTSPPIPSIELPMHQIQTINNEESNNNNNNSIGSELRETGGIIVKLLKLVNKWLNILYEKQLDKLEKYKKK